MDKTGHDCEVKANGIRCGLPLFLLPSGLLYCRRCNAVKVLSENDGSSGRKVVRTVLSEDERASLGLHGPEAYTRTCAAVEALAKGWIPLDSVLGKAVSAHGERWAAAMAGGDLQGKKSGTWPPR